MRTDSVEEWKIGQKLEVFKPFVWLGPLRKSISWPNSPGELALEGAASFIFFNHVQELSPRVAHALTLFEASIWVQTWLVGLTHLHETWLVPMAVHCPKQTTIFSALVARTSPSQCTLGTKHREHSRPKVLTGESGLCTCAAFFPPPTFSFCPLCRTLQSAPPS